MASLAFQSFSDTPHVPASVAAGTPIPVGSLSPITVSLESVGVGTYAVQTSCDNSSSPAATSWVNEGSAMTASGNLLITKPCAWVRLNVTAYTSGTPTLRLAGVQRT